LLFWRHGFSAKLAALSAVRDIDNIISNIQDDGKDKGSIEEDIQHANVFDDFLTAYRPKNEVMNIYATNWRGLFVSRTRSLAQIRLLYSAALLWLDRIEREEFPQSLIESKIAQVKDPYTGEAWGYIWTGDIVTLKSPGSDLVFDNQDDLSITLFKQRIQEFLEQTRL
jgi:hypothetical protein